MFTDPLKLMIHRRFLDGIGDLGLCEDEIREKIDRCTGDLLTVMEFYYGSMPMKDVGEYDFELLRKIAEFGLSLEQKTDWGEPIPEDIRLNYVLNYRADLEWVENSRAFFYQALQDRVRGKDLFQAALAVNAWCAEHVEYKPFPATGFSPIGILKAGGGNSRQLSTLEVTALRSVGIPARVVFTPAWAHREHGLCWVEFWAQGSWHFIEACRPGPLINQNWFAGNAARAMFLFTSAFLPPAEEEVIFCGKRTILVNVLNRYAVGKRLSLTVTEGGPVAGALIDFEILNGSELRPALSLVTDETGSASLTIGCGSIHIHARKGDRFVEAFVHTGESDHVALDFSQAAREEPSYKKEFVMIPPKDAAEFFIPLTDIQRANARGENEWAAQARKEVLARQFKEEEAKALVARYNQPARTLNLLSRAKGNFDEINRFLLAFFNADTRTLKLDFLETLSDCDLCNTNAAVLNDHFQTSLPFRERYDYELYLKNLMNPRIAEEPITAYRSGIIAQLGAHAGILRKDPRLLWKYIREIPCLTEPSLYNASPLSMLKTGLMDETGRRILFVAICRTFGYPARLNPVDRSAEYFFNGSFHSVNEKPSRRVPDANLILSGGSRFRVYRRHWTLAVLKDGSYHTLNLDGASWSENGELELSLRPGCYRLITAVRGVNENLYCIKTVFQLKSGESERLELKCHNLRPEEETGCVPLAPFRLHDMHFRSEMVNEIVKDQPAVLIWFQENTPDTDRLLLHFISLRSVISSLNCKVLLILPDYPLQKDPTVAFACRELPFIEIYSADFDDTAQLLVNRFGLEQGLYPLTLIVRPGPCVAYACAGYDEEFPERMIDILKRTDESIVD